MARLDCLFHFHCGQPTGSNEHVFPAALGGRRTDGRLICEACQGWTSQLDEVLPEQLRLLNVHLCVIGDHAKKPARVSFSDADTGRNFLVDEKMFVDGRGKGLLAQHTDESGYTVQRYDFLSEAEERRVLDELRANRINFDVLNRTVTPLLRTKPLTAGLEFGGDKAMRAIARVALNFLAIREPDVARALSLDPLKRWILSGEAETNTFVNFGAGLPPQFRVANQFEFGHRIIVGVDPNDGVFARIDLFDTFELAVRLGPVGTGRRRYYVWDVDPTARVQKPGIDRDDRDLAGILEHSPRVLGAFAATSAEVYHRVQAGHDRILGSARARIDREHVERLTRQASELFAVPRDRLPDRVQRLLRPELQCATNLVSRVAPLVEQQIRVAGYSWTADYVHALMDSEVPEFIVPVSGSVLSELGSAVVCLVEREDITAEQVHDLVFGMTGLSMANKVLVRTLASMRIWYKGDGPDEPS